MINIVQQQSNTKIMIRDQQNMTLRNRFRVLKMLSVKEVAPIHKGAGPKAKKPAYAIQIASAL